jgi:hypothetical protein
MGCAEYSFKQIIHKLLEGTLQQNYAEWK